MRLPPPPASKQVLDDIGQNSRAAEAEFQHTSCEQQTETLSEMSTATVSQTREKLWGPETEICILK